MFTFLKIIKPLLLPPGWIFIGFIASIFLFWRNRKRLGMMILILTCGVYYLLSIEPAAYFLNKSLETKFTGIKFEQTPEDIEAIVILAGGADEKDRYRLEPELGGVSWRRLWRGIEVYREFDGQVPILYSGGSGDPFDRKSIEAELAKSYAVSIGIPEENFWIEPNSRTTWESGIAIKDLLSEKFPDNKSYSVILVTSAKHIPRAVWVMEKAGINAIPSPADISGGALHIDILSFLPSQSYFSSSIESIHEWIGFAWYWIRSNL